MFRLAIFSIVLSSALCLVQFGSPVVADDIWIEGENSQTQQLKPHSWYSDAVKKDLLSGKNWASHFDASGIGTVGYEIDVTEPGDYSFWVRTNPIASRLSYQINQSGWNAIDTHSAVDVVNIANDGKPDLRFVGWVRVGSLKLLAGKSTIEFRMESNNNHHGGIDCFLLTQSEFEPSGTLQPGQKLGLAESGWWAFEPDPDPFDSNALVDLRFLNEKSAGQDGFIKSNGEQFLLGSGAPVRFWGINTGHELLKADDATIRMTARRWAKFGINLVRIHGALFDRTGDDASRIDRDKLKRLHHVVNAFKREGIYSHISFYFPLWMKLKPSDQINGSAIGKHPFALPYFEPKMQSMTREWVTQILSTPVDGRRLSDEPAIACIEIINEDSLFFWTFSAENLGPGPLKTLETQFAKYLNTKYGSIESALKVWRPETHPRDNAAQGRVAVLDAWNMTREGMRSSDGKRRRMTDQIAFLATLQRDYYAATAKHMRDVGCKSLMSASNWTTADNAVLGGIERWTYMATDVVDKHGYFGARHEGDASGYSVREGQRYEDASALLNPENVPISYWQTAGRPHLHSEIAWNKPNRFIADGNLLTASYAALQGVDGYVWFAAADGKWENTGNGKWTWMMPGEIGQSPAAALQYRRGDVAQSAPVRRLVSNDDDVMSLRGTHIIEGRNADFRTSDQPASDSQATLQSFDPLTPFVGRVERSFSPNAQPAELDISRFIDRESGLIKSITGELNWNYHDGWLTVNTPCSQAVTGFLSKAGSIELADIQIESEMQYGTIHVISLDGTPLSQSRRILIQAFSEEKMYGFQSTSGTIQNTGSLPINVRQIDGRVRFKGNRPYTVHLTDANGYPVDKGTTLRGDTLELNSSSMYTVLKTVDVGQE
ncbi:hypothetical protein [Stieleria varia]|uniref:Glycoside hydrolase family 42 N-terminal domain-containing protein n=1 Tax=Stieleria varia TaxID=2528005 RepID=A0A5C6A1L3_9BACT|nr:hypothetical protein [Stieleria varia]TWT93732.1 hypothetical protein Pla52n_55600 [Stieleria varia]